MQQEKTLVQFVDDYLKECQYSTRLSPQTIRAYKSLLFVFVSIMPEISSPQFLTPELLTEFFKRLQSRDRKVGNHYSKRGVTDNTILTYWRKLSVFFNWLHAQQIITVNPLRKLRPPRLFPSGKRALEEEEIKRLYASVTLHANSIIEFRRDTVMISLFAFCGLRRNEFLSLEITDLDFVRHLITVKGVTSKTKRSRLIPIHPTLLLHLKDYITERNKCGYKTHKLIVSTKKDAGLTTHGLKFWVKNLSKKSGVKFHVHQFRHFFACNLATKDVNAVKIQKLLGHSSLNMTMTYLQSISTENMQEDVFKISI